MEGITLKDAWQWGSESTVVNNPLGKPGHTPLYVDLPATWSSMDGDCIFSPHFMEGLLKWGL
jgi:hypothetical protein